MDVIDPRIDVGAQRAILRMRRGDPAARADGETLLDAVKSGRVAGIYGDDLRASAQLAARRGTVRWELVPRGRDAALVPDPPGVPSVIFREQARSVPHRLDPALRAVAAELRPGAPVRPVPGYPFLRRTGPTTGDWYELGPAPRPFRSVMETQEDQCTTRCGVASPGTSRMVVPWLVRIRSIFTEPPGPFSSEGSGFLIGPCHVLTAGHVVRASSERPPFRVLDACAVTARVADHVGNTRGTGIRTAVRWRSSLGWRTLGQQDAMLHDYGLLTLSSPVAGQGLGRWRVGPGVVPGQPALPLGLVVTTGGYTSACPPPEQQRFRAGRVVPGVSLSRVTLQATGGHSGSPVWTVDGGRPTLRGILTSVNRHGTPAEGGCDSNVLPLRASILAEVRAWIDEDVRDGLCGGGRATIDLSDAAVP